MSGFEINSVSVVHVLVVIKLGTLLIVEKLLSPTLAHRFPTPNKLRALHAQTVMFAFCTGGTHLSLGITIQ